MTIFFVLNHPAHFHLFKNLINLLKKNDHTCTIYIKPKDILEELLIESRLDYEIFYESNFSPISKFGFVFSKFYNLFIKDIRLSKKIIQNHPDLLIGTDWAITNVGKIFKIPSLVFNEDDTMGTPENKIFYPLASCLILPDSCDRGMWLNKRVSYAGYHELAYLHPNRFRVSPNIVFNELGGKCKFIIIRLVKLNASHDLGKKGLAVDLIKKIIESYKNNYKILISSEDKLFPDFKEYTFNFNPLLMHHFLSEASIVIGDSQTMIAEAAVLGTPALRFNDFIGKLSYLEELEHKYGLSYGFRTTESKKLLQKIDEILQIPNLKKEWKERQLKMLMDKIDVTAFMVWFIENYPKSFKIMKENPNETQMQFMQ